MPKEKLPPDQRDAKERFEELRGFWTSIFDELLFLQPEYIKKYAELSAHPGELLDTKVKELIHVAINCSTTHLYHRGTRSHINNAFDSGATLDEIVEVFILVSCVGISSSAEGAKILAEICELFDERNIEGSESREISDDINYWVEGFDELYNIDKDHLEQYLSIAALPWTHGNLDPTIKYFVLLAVEISPTRLNGEIAKMHAKNALNEGATVEEVMAVIETASVIGVHTMDSMAILIEEAAKRGKLPNSLIENDEYVTFRNPRYL